MKQAISTLFIFCIVLCTVSTAALADPTAMPENTQVVLDRALADPPISPAFLCDVAEDPKVMEYLTKAPIIVILGEGKIYFSEEGIAVECSIGCGDTVLYNDGSPAFAMEEKKRSTDEQSCYTTLKLFLMSYRESEFWSAFANALETE